MKICLIDAQVFITDEKLIAKLKEYGDVEVFDGIPETVEEVVRRAGDAEVIGFGLVQFTNEMIDALPKLKVLQFIGTGVSNFVDVAYAESKGITVKNIEGYGSNAVAEFALSMGLAINRKLGQANKVLKTGGWTIDNLCGNEIKGSVVGVVGTGSIGRLVAEKYHALGAKVIACDIFENEELKSKYGVEYYSMEDVFKKSDIVTLHMKVTPENERVINKKYFEIAKNNAVLVNVARAELVDNHDLYEALKNGNLRGAAIDVYDSEPPSESDYKLAQLDNVIASPHIGYYTQEANDNSIYMMADSIIESIK